ncbi:MAG: zinc ribbon domain-containing protein [Clostridia bacterium]|jgi:hypothetical protein|nr:zinc ribbon domain-containing protein [Clostridia bacterium]MBR0436364.1 zinc ribbon domain-containing protein [Clostridia bacterium]MBR2644550.1 zinc ribbon domain-containing protein [Clostridia bacterium]MBR3037987.1 zinc ribbon domain-containing protein [Clostridia bacterium]
MFCPNCGKEVVEGAGFCGNCGATIAQPNAERQTPPQPVVVQQPVTEATLPAQFRPLSPWAYFGYSILFSIPVVGFIMLIVFSCKKSNINRRNFARSYWCALILCVVLFAVLLIIAFLTGSIERLSYWIRSTF